jgi:hypothetical protein
VSTFDAGSIEARLTLDRSQFKRELDAARAEVKKFETGEHKANVDIDVDDEKAKAEVDKFEQKLRDIPNKKTTKLNIETGNGVTGTQLLVTAILAALPLIPPLVAVATAGIVALSAALLAAGAGAGILALGIIGVIKQYKDLTKHHKELTAAAKGYESALKTLKGAWDSWIAAIAPTALNLITQFFKLIASILPRLTPIFKAFADVASGALNGLSDWVKGSGGTSVLKWIQSFGAASFDKILHILGNVAQTLLNLLMAFSPLASDMLGWLDKLTAGWVTWSSTLASNPQFQQFIQYVRDNGPLVWNALVGLGKALIAIGVAIAPLGPPLLGIITSFSNFISMMDPGKLQAIVVIIISLVAAWTVFEAIMSVVAAAVALYNGVALVASGVTKVWAAAQWLLNAAWAASPIGLIIIGIAAFIAIIIIAYARVGWFRGMIDGLWSKMAQFGKWLGGWADSLIHDIGGAFAAAYHAVLSFGGLIRSAGVSAFNSLRNGISSAIGGIVSRVTSAFASIRSWVTSTADSIRANVISRFNAMTSGIQGALSRALGLVRSIVGSIKGVFSGAGGWLAGAGRAIIDGLVNGISSAIGRVRDILSSVTNLIPDWKGPADKDAKLLHPAGNLIMQGLISGIQNQLPNLQGTLGGVTDMIGGTSGVASASVGVSGRIAQGGGSSPQVTINNYYPVSEPSSVGAVRGIKDLAVLGVFGG